ncbi:MAG TPA: hypothetical protein VLW49_10045 [Gaiellaceae bacterium]|nr:hypothetical protein [Gaiellaceae bacterium]
MTRAVTFIAVLAVAAAVAGTPAASSPGQSPGDARARYPDYGLSFRYPANWTRVDWCWIGASFVTPITLLTSVRPAPTCTSTTHSGTSWPPRQRLGTNDVTVLWSLDGFPGGLREPGRRTRIADRAALLAYLSPGAPHGRFAVCRRLGARRMMQATIPAKAPDNYVFAVACLRGPDFAPGERAVVAMLASTRLAR